MSPQELLDYIGVLKQYRINYEPNWYRSFYAYENNTFTSWNRVTQSLVRLPYRKRFFINLPEIKKQSDSFESLLLQFMPIFVAYPEDISDSKQVRNSGYYSKILKQTYLSWDANNIIHRYVHNAIKYPVSFIEIGIENKYNSKTHKLEKKISPVVSDVFDYLFDPRVDFEDNRVIVKILRKTKKEIKDFKNFKMPKEGNPSPEDFKEMIFANKYGTRQASGDLETVTVYQALIKEETGIRMMIIDKAANILEQDFYKGATFYPVVPLQLYSGDVYQPSFVENLIPINRSMSLIANRIEDFIMKFVKGGYLIREGTDITFSDENGIVVKYSGEQPQVMPIPNMPAAIIAWWHELISLSERYGVNEIASGGTPQGSQMRAGKMMTQAVQNQQNQQKTPLDNLMQSFKRVAEVTLYYLSEYTDVPQNFSFKDSSVQGGFDSNSFVGEKYAINYPDSIPIPHEITNLQIEIEDNSTTTINAKRADLLELAQAFANVPPTFQKVLLDLYKVGNTADLMNDLEKGQTLWDNIEWQNLVEQARSGQLPPETVQAISQLSAFLAKQSPTPGVDGQGSAPSPVQASAQPGQPSPDQGQPPPPPTADPNAPAPEGQPSQGGDSMDGPSQVMQEALAKAKAEHDKKPKGKTKSKK